MKLKSSCSRPAKVRFGLGGYTLVAEGLLSEDMAGSYVVTGLSMFPKPDA